jgi:hypothetical protein
VIDKLGKGMRYSEAKILYFCVLKIIFFIFLNRFDMLISKINFKK